MYFSLTEFLVDYIFKEIDPFHLSVQLYGHRVLHNILYYYFNAHEIDSVDDLSFFILIICIF